MSHTLLLTLSWSDYEERKKRENTDVLIFCPEHPWELTYLIRKIREEYRQYTETAIFTSIRTAMNEIPAPRKRPEFVTYVIKNLLQRQPCLLN